jgi:pimeloyl-ACP methyl ester carboxylesterase
MRVERIERDGARLCLYDTLVGAPVLFQHGLGGDAAQVAENFPDGPRHRRITLECRAQGASEPGSRRPFSIAMFADDLLAACDERGVGRFVLGGISMGAAIALRIATLNPQRVSGLVLARPAWLFDAAPANMRPFSEVAACLRRSPPEEAKADFSGSPTGLMLLEKAPDNLASMLKFFDRPDPAVTADLLSDIAGDGPAVTAADAAHIGVPTLVIGHAVDHVHPLATAQALAKAIRGAHLAEITPKAIDKPRHVAEFRQVVSRFLEERTR